MLLHLHITSTGTHALRLHVFFKKSFSLVHCSICKATVHVSDFREAYEPSKARWGWVNSTGYIVANMDHSQNQTASFSLYVLLLRHFHTAWKARSWFRLDKWSHSVHHAHADTPPTAQSQIIMKPTEVSRLYPHKSAKQRWFIYVHSSHEGITAWHPLTLHALLVCKAASTKIAL